MKNDHADILPEVQEGLDAPFNVKYLDENGELQTVTTSLAEAFAPFDYAQIERDIRASSPTPAKRKKKRGFSKL
jgi:hypothetical protein